MARSATTFGLLATQFVLLLSSARADPAGGGDGRRESKAPSAATRGEVFEWKAANGIPYEYFVPKSYDAKAGANLTLVLHGNGLDHRWTFLNHPAGKFRPDDVVVSLEGPTLHAGTGAREFLDTRECYDQVHEVIAELKKLFNVRATFLYGHSQGSFFVFGYAGEFPADVNGVVGHAGALWMSSKLAKAGHRQAIAFLHGTEDANVWWSQSADGRQRYRDADYPLVHLRTLWRHEHAPVWEQAENQLAWCEGMTSEDPARVASALETLSRENVPYGVDFAALFAVAARLEGMAGATAAQKSAATKARAAVEKTGKAIAAEIDRSLGKGKLTKVDGKPWLGLALRFREDFDGTAPYTAWAKTHAAELAALEKEATSSGREFGQQSDKDAGKAIAAGVDVLEKGWTNLSAVRIAARLEELLRGASDLGKKEAARASGVLEAWRKGRAEGLEAFEKLARGFSP